MIVECVNVVFVNDAIFKSSGYDDFIVQINKVMETVWKSVLNFTYTWQLTLVIQLAQWRRVVFVAFSCEYFQGSAKYNSMKHGRFYLLVEVFD